MFASCTVYKFASIKFYLAELAKAREPFLRKKVDLWLRERPDVKGNYHFSYAIVDEGRKTCKVAIALVDKSELENLLKDKPLKCICPYEYALAKQVSSSTESESFVLVSQEEGKITVLGVYKGFPVYNGSSDLENVNLVSLIEYASELVSTSTLVVNNSELAERFRNWLEGYSVRVDGAVSTVCYTVVDGVPDTYNLVPLEFREKLFLARWFQIVNTLGLVTFVFLAALNWKTYQTVRYLQSEHKKLSAKVVSMYSEYRKLKELEYKLLTLRKYVWDKALNSCSFATLPKGLFAYRVITSNYGAEQVEVKISKNSISISGSLPKSAVSFSRVTEMASRIGKMIGGSVAEQLLNPVNGRFHIVFSLQIKETSCRGFP